jgi:hypothetical protein
MSWYTVEYTVLVTPGLSEPSSAPITTGGLVTVGFAGASDSELGTATVVVEAKVAVAESEAAASEQDGDTVTVLVAVSVTVTGSQVGAGGTTGPAPEQAPSRTKNLEVWAWMTKTLVPLMALLWAVVISHRLT